MHTLNEIRKFHLYGDDFKDYIPDLVHIEEIRARAKLHNWSIKPHRHPSILQLLYMEGGRGILIADGEEAELQLPALVIIPCDCPHAYRFSSDAQGVVLSLADALLRDRRLEALDLDRFVNGNQALPIVLDESSQAPLIAMLFKEITRRRLHPDAQITDGLCALLALLLSLADEAASSRIDQNAGPPSPRTALVRGFFTLIEEHLRESWSIADFADALGSSPATLTRACRDVTGKSPARLVNERRIVEAKRALSFTNASVNQIADDLGFSDPAYFARNFRQHVGLTASAYRRKTTMPEPALRATRRSRA